MERQDKGASEWKHLYNHYLQSTINQDLYMHIIHCLEASDINAIKLLLSMTVEDSE
jgi:hypothetical protein